MSPTRGYKQYPPEFKEEVAVLETEPGYSPLKPHSLFLGRAGATNLL